MKYLNINYISVVLLLLMVTAVSCDTLSGDPDLPIPLDETLESTGAFLRMDSVASPGFDVADLSTAEYAFIGSISSNEQGADVDRVEFFASYESATDPNLNVDEPTDPVKTYAVADMSTDENTGLPQTEFSVELVGDLLPYLGINQGDLALGDRFNVRWTVVTDDGTRFSVEQASPAVGGGFYSSPYNANASVVQSIPEDIFIGEYTFTQTTAGSALLGGPLFGQDGTNTFTATLQLDQNNTLNGRTITLNYLGWFFGGPNLQTDVQFTFFRRQDFQAFVAADNYVTTSTAYVSNVGCGGPTADFAPTTDITLSGFDVNNDSSFEMALVENTTGACGAPEKLATFTATKN